MGFLSLFWGVWNSFCSVNMDRSYLEEGRSIPTSKRNSMYFPSKIAFILVIFLVRRGHHATGYCLLHTTKGSQRERKRRRREKNQLISIRRLITPSFLSLSLSPSPSQLHSDTHTLYSDNLRSHAAPEQDVDCSEVESPCTHRAHFRIRIWLEIYVLAEYDNTALAGGK